MTNQEWWAAERKAAEFWRKVKANQSASQGGTSLKHEPGAAPIVRPEDSAASLQSQTGLVRPLDLIE
jgi:hypothetical protein